MSNMFIFLLFTVRWTSSFSEQAEDPLREHAEDVPAGDQTSGSPCSS